MATTFRNPHNIHPLLGAYAHQAEAIGATRWLVMAGQVGRSADGKVPTDPLEQIEVALENVRRNLDGAGMETRVWGGKSQSTGPGRTNGGRRPRIQRSNGRERYLGPTEPAAVEHLDGLEAQANQCAAFGTTLDFRTVG